MRNLGENAGPDDDLVKQINKATVQRYCNRTDKRARYRPKNPDIKPLGDPEVRPLKDSERAKLAKYQMKMTT